MKPYLSIIIPCYNEEVNIHLGALDKVVRFVESQKYTSEIIIIDDGSNDGSLELVKRFAEHNKNTTIIENNHGGKAAAVTTGMLAAKGQFRVFLDMDQAVPIEEISKLLPYFSQKYDVVIGSRNSVRQGAPLLRKVMALGFMKLRGMILGMDDIVDTQCGFKGFSEKAALYLFQKLQVYTQNENVRGSRVTAGFDVELLYLAKKHGYRIKEVSVHWHHVDTRRVNPIRDSIEGLFALLKIKSNDTQGKYS